MIIMKKLSSLLIGCSLALAGAVWAQQPAEQQSPSKGKRAPEKTHAAEAKPGAFAPGFASAACVFSGARFPFDGDCCSAGCCAHTAPANASEQPINKLLSFFIIIMFGC